MWFSFHSAAGCVQKNPGWCSTDVRQPHNLPLIQSVFLSIRYFNSHPPLIAQIAPMHKCFPDSLPEKLITEFPVFAGGS